MIFQHLQFANWLTAVGLLAKYLERQLCQVKRYKYVCILFCYC